MAETFIIDPRMTDDQILTGITQKTRFVVIDDHMNVEPTGGPMALQYIQGKVHIIDQLIRDLPNCVFIMDNYRSSVADQDNVASFPAIAAARKGLVSALVGRRKPRLGLAAIGAGQLLWHFRAVIEMQQDALARRLAAHRGDIGL